MQGDNLDILGALASLVGTVKESNQLSTKPLDQWPIYSATVKTIEDQTGEPTYQCQELKKLSQAKTYFESKYTDYCSDVTSCITVRLAWSDLDLTRDIIFMLATLGLR